MNSDFLRSVPLLFLASALAAQQPDRSPETRLRRALAGADRVVVGRCLDSREVAEVAIVYRLQIDSILEGDQQRMLYVLEPKGVVLHQRPTPRQTRLYCLLDAQVEAERMGLPAVAGDYVRMVGHPGSNPKVDPKAAADPWVAFARLLLADRNGQRHPDTADALVKIALGNGPARIEAVLTLAEREALRARVIPVHWPALLSRAVGEDEDIEYKIALAALCAEQEMTSLVPSLVLSLPTVDSDRFAKTLGRIAKKIHGENAPAFFAQGARAAKQAKVRARFLLAMGATRTEAALRTLLQLRAANKEDRAVEAALAAHGSQRALEAIGRGKKDG